MDKKFSKLTVAAMKRTAQNVDQFIGKRDRLQAKIATLQVELDGINAAIDMADAPTKALTGGYGSEDLFEKVFVENGAKDKDGKPIKTAKFVLKYPETVVPVAVEAANGAEAVAEQIASELADKGEVPPYATKE